MDLADYTDNPIFLDPCFKVYLMVAAEGVAIGKNGGDTVQNELPVGALIEKDVVF